MLRVFVVLAAVALGLRFARHLRDLPRRSSHPTPAMRAAEGAGPFPFPSGFLWGAATADQQIEHQQPSDWTTLEQAAQAAGRASVTAQGLPLPGHIAGITAVSGDVLAKKADYDRVFDEDLKRAAAMGHNAHRFSISWARLFPRPDMRGPDPAGLAFYTRIFDALERHGLAPCVTLFHFACPAWLQDVHGGRRGVERDDAVEHFTRFTAAVARAFGDRVRVWCTLNEPMVYAVLGYLGGLFPPNERRRRPADVVSVVRALLAMHAAAYRCIHEEAYRHGVRASVGIAQHVRAVLPWRNHAPLDRVAAAAIDRLFVVDFLDAVQTGLLRMARLGVAEQIPGLAGTMDYVGVNHYGRMYVKRRVARTPPVELLFQDAHDPDEERSDLGWAADDQALTATLARFSARYRLPLYVLENGIADAADDDVRRQRFLVRHAHAVWRAMHRHGADVRGYFHWSLIDNFEWAAGFSPRFGLYAVDYDHDFRRRPRGSVEVYRRIAVQNVIPAEVWQRYR